MIAKEHAMAALTIRNIPDDLYQDLKEYAAKHQRSLNKEVVMMLERTMGRKNADAMEWLQDVDALRDSLSVTPLTDRMMCLFWPNNRGVRPMTVNLPLWQ